MYNCIYSGHCFEHQQCDKSCPTLAQTTYLLERNGIKMNSAVFKMKPSDIQKFSKILKESQGQLRSYIDIVSTAYSADCLTYCSICDNWKGSQLHCTVYNLRLGQYIDSIQKSWSNSASTAEADYMKIWASSAKVLIVSNIDFINFKDFQCQTLLSLIQSRTDPDMTTIIVSPPTSSLVGDGPFFSRLCDIINKQKVG